MVRRRLQVSGVGPVGARRPSRLNVQPRRPAVPAARLAALNTRPMSVHRARRLSAVRMQDRSRLRLSDTGHQLPLGIELLRAVVLLAAAILAVLIVLPTLLEFAAAQVR